MSSLLKNFSIEERAEHEEAKIRLNILSKELLSLGLYFHWYLFQKLPAFYVYGTNATAYVDGFGLYVSKGFLERPNNEQLFILRHELYHMVFHHPLQMAKSLARAKTTYERNILRIVSNIIGDAIVNGVIMKEDESLGIKTPIENYISPEEINKVLEADVAKLGYANAVDKLLYMINKGDVTLTVVNADEQPVDIVNTPIDDLMEKYEVLLAVLENKKNGAKVGILLQLDNNPTSGSEANVPEEGKEREEQNESENKSDSESDNEGRSAKSCKGRDSKSSKKSRGKSGRGSEEDQNKKSGGSGEGASSQQKNEKKIEMIKKPIGGQGPKTQEDLERLIREAIEFDNYKRMTEGDKRAGVGRAPPDDFLLGEITVKKPEWEALLTSTISNFISKTAIVSWHFVNRRAPFEKPGIRYMTTPDMHILLDVSGSMLDGTLTRALERILHIAENYQDSKVMLYKWSDGVSPPEKIDRKFAENVKKYKKINIETGGTVIEPALDVVLSKVSKKDVVIVLTDGYIYDIDKNSVIEKFRKLTQKAGLVIFASLGYIPETLPPQVVKIRLED